MWLKPHLRCRNSATQNLYQSPLPCHTYLNNLLTETYSVALVWRSSAVSQSGFGSGVSRGPVRAFNRHDYVSGLSDKASKQRECEDETFRIDLFVSLMRSASRQSQKRRPALCHTLNLHTVSLSLYVFLSLRMSSFILLSIFSNWRCTWHLWCVV